MRLNHYLSTRGVTAEDFAKKIGASRAAVYKWRQHQRIPRPAMVKKIRQATRGKVREDDWYGNYKREQKTVVRRGRRSDY